MAAETKKGAPRTGLYLRVFTADIEDFFPKMRQAFLVINRSDYEKNMHVLEINLSSDDERNLEGAALLKDIAQAAGIVALVRNNIALARSIEADGVMLDNIDDIKIAKMVLEERNIIGLRCQNDKNRAQKALAEGIDFISFGSDKFLPDAPLVKWWVTQTEKPALVEGHVTSDNAQNYAEIGAGFVECTGYIFNHPKGAMQGAVNILFAIDLAAGPGSDQKLN